MVFFNYALRKLNAKIVYYGPGLCGKTTNLQWIHDHFEGGQRGRMISLATEGDRTIFFDLLPLDIGAIRGMQVTLQLYTVPGQVHYNSTRQLVLKGADGVVFVADSQRAMLKSNQDSWRNLQENLLLQGVELRSFPHVIQFNKRDLRDIMSVEDLDAFLNQYDCPIFEAIATDGVGVQESLEGIVKLVMRSLKERYEPVPAGAPGPPQPAGSSTSGAWPSVSAPSSTRPGPPPTPAVAAPSHPLDVDTDTIGVTTRQLPPAPEPEPVTAAAGAFEAEASADETPTLVSEAEALDEAEVIVPAAVPLVEREIEGTDTATGPELFVEAPVDQHAGGAVGEVLIDDPTAVSETDRWGPDESDDERWPDDDRAPADAADHSSELTFGAGRDDPFEAEAASAQPSVDDGEERFLPDAEAADDDVPAPVGEGYGEHFDPAEEAWSTENGAWPSAAVAPDVAEIGDEDEIEPAFDLVPGALDELPIGTPEPGSPEWEVVSEAPPTEPAPPVAVSRGAGELFFVSDEDPFDQPFDVLRDEPTATHTVTAEASALVTSPGARLSSVDVDPASNQLHVRLHGHGALAEYGQVRELDIMVPVPGQWIGNRRVTLQLRLTLTPATEDEYGGQGGAS